MHLIRVASCLDLCKVCRIVVKNKTGGLREQADNILASFSYRKIYYLLLIFNCAGKVDILLSV